MSANSSSPNAPASVPDRHRTIPLASEMTNHPNSQFVDMGGTTLLLSHPLPTTSSNSTIPLAPSLIPAHVLQTFTKPAADTVSVNWGSAGILRSSGIDFDLLGSLLAVKSEKEAQVLAQQFLGDGSHLANSRAAMIASKASALHNSYDPSAKFTFFSASRGLLQGATLASVAESAVSSFMSAFSPKNGAGSSLTLPVEPFWLDVYSPTPIDLALMARIFSIHPLTLEDMTTDEAREKVEGYDGYLFMCLRTLADDTESMDGLKLKEEFYYALLFKDICVLTVRHAPLRHVFNVALRLVTGSGLSAVTASSTETPVGKENELLAPDWILYCIIDDVIDSLRPVIQGLEFNADGIDDLAQILQWNEQADLLQRLRRASKKVTQLIRLLHLKEEVVKSLSNPGRSASYIQPATIIFLRDIFDHIITLQHSLGIIKETLHTAHSGYHSQLSVAMSQLSNHMNASMKRITVIGTAFVPITAVTGLFGMNVPVPGSDAAGPLYWFFGILFGTLFISFFVVYLLEKTQRRLM